MTSAPTARPSWLDQTITDLAKKLGKKGFEYESEAVPFARLITDFWVPRAAVFEPRYQLFVAVGESGELRLVLVLIPKKVFEPEWQLLDDFASAVDDRLPTGVTGDLYISEEAGQNSRRRATICRQLVAEEAGQIVSSLKLGD